MPYAAAVTGATVPYAAAVTGATVPYAAAVTGADVYTHGHHSTVVNQHAQRTAEDCAAFARHVIAPDARILDVGCGPASITVGLARWAERGHVTGIEMGDDILATAAATVAEAGVGNVTLAKESVYELPYPDGSFDVAYAHQVLQHLSEPVAAIREMARVVQAGGWVAVRDSDYSTMRGFPSSEGITRWREVYRQVCRHNSAEPDAGRHLYSWFRHAGLAQVDMSASVWQFFTPETRRNWGYSWAERSLKSSFAHQAVEYGYATSAEMEDIAAAWRAWADTPDGYFHFIHAEALAQVA